MRRLRAALEAFAIAWRQPLAAEAFAALEAEAAEQPDRIERYVCSYQGYERRLWASPEGRDPIVHSVRLTRDGGILSIRMLKAVELRSERAWIADQIGRLERQLGGGPATVRGRGFVRADLPERIETHRFRLELVEAEIRRRQAVIAAEVDRAVAR